jgi:hydrogenase nickel incorporation protein HypB
MPKIQIVENILNANDQIAAENQQLLHKHGIFAINIMASPGAGKTSFLLSTIQALSPAIRIGVIEGDTAPVTIDSDKVQACGIPVVQVNTGGQCHLDAGMVKSALAQLPLDKIDLLIIENVGNLICPAAFQLGTHLNLVISSIPEGDDKPYKYPGMYRHLDVLVLNKTDLKPYVDFNLDYFRQGVEALNPGVAFFEVSCKTGEGLPALSEWLKARITAFKHEK